MVLGSSQLGLSAPTMSSFSSLSTEIVAHPLDAVAKSLSTTHLCPRPKSAAVSDTREFVPSSLIPVLQGDKEFTKKGVLVIEKGQKYQPHQRVNVGKTINCLAHGRHLLKCNNKQRYPRILHPLTHEVFLLPKPVSGIIFLQMGK